MVVRTRFAPSPTGYFHLGSLFSALYAFLWAKKNSGQFILRLEDTDRERYVPGSEQTIYDMLKAFKLFYDEGPDVGGPKEPYVQSQRLPLYHKHLPTLLNNDKAYYCFCTPQELDQQRAEQQKAKLPPRYNGRCRDRSVAEVEALRQQGKPFVVRLKVPRDQVVEFTDVLRGQIKVQSSEIDDQVLIKSDGFPTYHYAVVVDDHDMEITHVIRGQEWLPSTPKQILLYQAFGWSAPVFAHTNVIVDENRKKLSKRFGDVSSQSYIDKGYLPQALLNFVALLGWNPGGDQELFSLEEMIQKFDLADLHKAPAFFDLAKLDWMNHEYILKLSDDEFDAQIKSFLPASIVPTPTLRALLRQRLKKFSDAPEELKFLQLEKYDPTLLIFKKSDQATTKIRLQAVLDLLARYTDSFTKDKLKNYFMEYLQSQSIPVGEMLWPFRIALAGQKNSPDVFEMAEILGPEETTKRLLHALTQPS